MGAGLVPIDLDYARCGYLTLPSGRPRPLLSIETLAADAQRLGARLFWADLPPDRAGACDCLQRRIYLARWIAPARGPFLRRVLTNELAHITVGPNEERARWWQWRVYGDLLLPVWMA